MTISTLKISSIKLVRPVDPKQNVNTTGREVGVRNVREFVNIIEIKIDARIVEEQISVSMVKKELLQGMRRIMFL
jgi:hypothetical protein